MTGVLPGREEDTEERWPREDRGRDWGDVATSQGLLGAARNGKREGRMLPWSAEGAWLWLHVASDSGHQTRRRARVCCASH